MITIRNVSHTIGSNPILNDVSLDIPEGGITALIGPNGAGKSTLLSFMARLQPLIHGNISYAGKDIKTTPTAELARTLSILTQENSIMSRITVRDLLMFGRYPYHQGRPSENDKTIVEEALAEFHLQDFADRYLTELSGGQRQRAMIAMAVSAQPKLLIADEPTTALDVAVQAQILDLLSRLQEEHGMTMLYITHDLNLVRRFADDVAVMRNGRILETGKATEVFANPQHEYTKMLLNAGTTRRVAPLPENPATVLKAEQIAFSVKESDGWFKKRDKTILNPVSFDLKSGETLGIIGESGCGKTTLAKAVMHLIDSEGSLHINGEPWRHELRREIQMVFQDPFGAFNPRMNVFDTVSEALRVHEPEMPREEMRRRVQEVLKQVGLPEDALERYPHAFSGGQRQRLAIARAIIVRPKILVLDEPTSALDVQWQQQILELLSGLQKEYGLAFIIISHDLAVIRAISHRVMVLKDGKIVEEGECENVFANPSSDYTRHLIAHSGHMVQEAV